MVSKDDMLGLRERRLVGVDGIEDADDGVNPGYGSLNLVASMRGEECTDPGLLAVLLVALEILLCSDGESGRLLGREKLFCICINGGDGTDLG